MNKIYLGSLLLLSAVSHSQSNFQTGTFVSNAKGQKIKLHIKEDKKYELVFLQGDYEIKKDTINFKTEFSEDTPFSVNFSPDANPSKGKVKVKLTGEYINYYFSSLYFGTQSGKAQPVFEGFSKYAPDPYAETNELVFEIPREDFFYLVKDDYTENTELYKYAIPRNAQEIRIEYSANYLGKMNLQGYFNENGELIVAEKGKKISALAFVPETKTPPKKEPSAQPVEVKTETNWTFPGKNSYSDYAMAVDSSATLATSYKLTVQENLQKALDVAKKKPENFLVISYDPDNKNAKSEFDEFIKNQEYSIGTYISYEYADKTKNYDKYQFYNATAKDKLWASKNKISDNPSTIVLDSEGTILSQTKGNITQNQYSFDVYSNSENLLAVKAISDLDKALNSKAKDAVILKKLLPLSDSNSSWSIYPPLSAQTNESYAIEDVKGVAVDSAVAYTDYYAQNEPVYTKINIDKKKLLATWESLVKNHSKDAKPNMDFVKVALSEIQNRGFYFQIYQEERLYDDANFKAIEYLLKHYDAILKEQGIEATSKEEVESYYHMYNKIEWVLPNAILSNSNLVTPETSIEYQKRLLSVYRQIIEKQGSGSVLTTQYFTALETFSRTTNSEKEYVSEYDGFFHKTFKGANEIEVLDEMFSAAVQKEFYNDWLGFKNSFANASNQAAWFVVEKSNNPESVKKAIKWSESSLRIEKNNAYYLDTLAQLYYKNGEKQKAISTQEKALKQASEVDETTKQDMQNVLEKMKSGTY